MSNVPGAWEKTTYLQVLFVLQLQFRYWSSQRDWTRLSCSISLGWVILCNVFNHLILISQWVSQSRLIFSTSNNFSKQTLFKTENQRALHTFRPAQTSQLSLSSDGLVRCWTGCKNSTKEWTERWSDWLSEHFPEFQKKENGKFESKNISTWLPATFKCTVHRLFIN